MNGEDKDKVVTKQVELRGDALETFLKLKKKLLMENDTDVLRFSISYTERQFR